MGVVTVVFTDLVGSTAQLVRLGHDDSERLRREHFRIVRDAAAPRGGREVKSTGDGLMVVFDSPLAAVEMAIAVQRATARRNRGGAAEEVSVRIGVNVGEADEDQGDFYGLPVTVARRLCDSADSAQILVSRTVRDLVGDRAAASIEALGPRPLKGLPDTEVFEVRWTPDPAAGQLPPPLTARERRFVGRTAELSELGSAIQRSRRDGLQLAFLVGEPGIGKTTAAAELASLAAASGAVVLYGRCDEDALVPYQPLVEAVQHHVSAVGPPEPPAAWTAELGRFVTALRSEGAPASAADPATARLRLFEAASAFLADVAADGPAVAIFDDLHWADSDTLLLVEHLVRGAASAPILLVGTYRDTDLRRGHPLLATLARFRRQQPHERYHLGGLDPDDLVALTGLDRAAARAIAKETGGNPFFALEIARDVLAGQRVGSLAPGDPLPLPESVREVVDQRVEQVAEATRDVLSAACIFGSEVDLRLLRRVLDCSDDDLLDALDEAVVTHLLVEHGASPDRWVFPHSLIRAALLDSLTGPRRQRLHARAAEAMEAVGELRTDTGLVAHGAHVRSAGSALEPAEAIPRLLDSAEAARRLGAWSEVIASWSTVITLLEAVGSEPADRARLLERLGDLRYATGLDRESGARDLAAAAAIYEELDDEAGLARIRSRMGRNLSSYPEAMDVERAMGHYREAAAVLGARPDDPANAYLDAGMAGAALYGLLNEEGVEAARRARSRASRLGLRALAAQMLAVEGGHLAYRGDLAEGLALMAAAAQAADEVDDAFAGFLACWIHSWGQVLLRDPAVAVELVDREVAKPRLAPAPVQRHSLWAVWGTAQLCRGHLAEARQLDREVTGNVPLFVPLLHFLEGEWRAGAEGLSATAAVLDARGNRADHASLTPWLALAQARVGHTDAAVAVLVDALDGIAGPCPYIELPARSELAMFGHEPQRNLERCDEILAAGEEWRGLTARVALAHGVVDEDEAALEQALAVSRRYGLVWDEGEVLERWGRIDEAHQVYAASGTGGAWLL